VELLTKAEKKAGGSLGANLKKSIEDEYGPIIGGDKGDK
jgi:hypothetical protein